MAPSCEAAKTVRREGGPKTTRWKVIPEDLENVRPPLSSFPLFSSPQWGEAKEEDE